MRKVKKNILEMNDGEIFEKAEYEHNKIMANINDPSTDDKPRELIVKIKYVPNRAQKKVDIIPFVSSKLGKIVPIGKTMSITQMILQDTGEKVDVLQEITGEADGGEWQCVAQKRVSEYLYSELSEQIDSGKVVIMG